jgi:hypothetical protein
MITTPQHNPQRDTSILAQSIARLLIHGHFTITDPNYAGEIDVYASMYSHFRPVRELVLAYLDVPIPTLWQEALGGTGIEEYNRNPSHVPITPDQLPDFR